MSFLWTLSGIRTPLLDTIFQLITFLAQELVIIAVICALYWCIDKKLAVQIGAPDSRVHDLRHTFAVLSLQNGDDVKTVQGNLGHATAAFTLDVYGHVSERMKEDSAARMEEYIKELVNR